MKKAILVAIIGAMTLGVNAGDWGKAPVSKQVIEECYDIGGEVSVGYETDYIFYGARVARDSVWADVNYTFDSLWAPVNVGAWYLSAPGTGASPSLDELDLYASVELGSYAGVDASLGYTHYFYPGALPSYGEIGLDLAYGLGFADLAFEANYALFDGRGGGSGGGWYYQLGLERGFGITDAVSLVLGAGVGYSDNYHTHAFIGAGFPPAGGAAPRGSGWNHYYFTASLPIELNCRATLTPYVGYNGAGDGWVVDGIQTGNGPQSDILHGGVSLSVSF